MLNKRNFVTVVLVAVWVLSSVPAFGLTRVGDITSIQGARDNILKGYGLVVGLAGTGDGVNAALRAQQRLLRRMQVEVTSTRDLSAKNVAVVMVTATLQPYAREGTRIDVVVNSLFDASSLGGGTLLETLLYDVNGDVYAIAQGPVSVGGFAAGAAGASLRKNHVTVGTIPGGALVEREVPAQITDGESLNLLLQRPDFLTASNISAAVNEAFGDGTAEALNASTINVIIPESYYTDPVRFIASVEQLEAKPGIPAKVVINERTGTVVVGGDVTLSPVGIAQGGLTIQIKVGALVSQPAPLSPGQTVVVPEAEVTAADRPAQLEIADGADVSEIAEALNNLGVTPRDLISIFQALQKAGALHAELELM